MARNRRRRGSGGGILVPMAAVLGIFGLSAAMAGVYYYTYLGSQGATIDGATLCPENGPEAHLAILIDTTDPMSLTQLEAARQQIERRVAEASVHTRISFSTVSPDGITRKETYFSMCKPQSGEEASFLTQNQHLVEERFQAEFAIPVQDALNALLHAPEAQSSPIMESAQEFAARIPGFAVTKVPREFVLMSDLVQHSDVFSFFRGDDWESFANAGGPTRFGSAFEGATITVLRIPRLSKHSAVIDDFWVRYFDAQGFRHVRVTQIGDL
jgi:hypothetical protein